MAGPRIVVVGSINLDLVVRVPTLPRPGETVAGGTFAQVPGGKVANQAVMRAAAAGKIAPSDAILMQRGIKATWQAVKAEHRQRFRLAP